MNQQELISYYEKRLTELVKNENEAQFKLIDTRLMVNTCKTVVQRLKEGETQEDIFVCPPYRVYQFDSIGMCNYSLKPKPTLRMYKNLDEAKVAFGRTVFYGESKDPMFIILGGNEKEFFYRKMPKDDQGTRSVEFNSFGGYKFCDTGLPVGIKD